jgi:hypothetical protein
MYETAGDRVVQVEAVRPHGSRPDHRQVERVSREHEVAHGRPGPAEEDALGGTAEKRGALFVGWIESLDPVGCVRERLVPPVQDRGLRAPHDALPAQATDEFAHPGNEDLWLEKGLPGEDHAEALVGKEVRHGRVRTEDSRVRRPGEVTADRQCSRIPFEEVQQCLRPVGQTVAAAADKGNAVGVADLIQQPG